MSVFEANREIMAVSINGECDYLGREGRSNYKPLAGRTEITLFQDH